MLIYRCLLPDIIGTIIEDNCAESAVTNSRAKNIVGFFTSKYLDCLFLTSYIIDMRTQLPISFTKAMNKANNNKIFICLFLIIGLCTFSLYLSTITVNAQPSSNSTSSSNNTTNETRVTHMGICVVGAGGPCNGG